MEQLTETITLDVEEANELAFRLKIEGAEAPAKVRLVCENGDMAYMFSGRGTSEDGVVQFIVPQMKGKLQEGTYHARVEVLIENRYFSPVQFQMHFKKTMQVFAESITAVPAVVKPEIRVSAAPIVVTPISKQTQARVESAPVPEKTPTPARPTQQPVKQQQQQPRKPLSAGSTLKERFNNTLSDTSDEDLINILAKKLLSSKLR